MTKPSSIGLGLVLLLGLTGCKSLAEPNWLHPGADSVQRSRALRYDPYPENDAGPTVVGSRPRGYQKELPETSRGRWFLGNWGQK